MQIIKTHFQTAVAYSKLEEWSLRGSYFRHNVSCVTVYVKKRAQVMYTLYYPPVKTNRQLFRQHVKERNLFGKSWRLDSGG